MYSQVRALVGHPAARAGARHTRVVAFRLRYTTLRHSTLQHTQCGTAQRSTVQYSAVQCSAVPQREPLQHNAVAGARFLPSEWTILPNPSEPSGGVLDGAIGGVRSCATRTRAALHLHIYIVHRIVQNTLQCAFHTIPSRSRAALDGASTGRNGMERTVEWHVQCDVQFGRARGADSRCAGRRFNGRDWNGMHDAQRTMHCAM